jgi:hypothetical protein
MISVELKAAIRSVRIGTEEYFDTKRLFVDDGKVTRIFGHKIDNKTWAAPIIELPHKTKHTRTASVLYDVVWVSYYDLPRFNLVAFGSYGFYIPVDELGSARGLGLL